MLQWNDLHPYNAVHVVRIPRLLELNHLRDVINSTLETQGLIGLTLNRKQGTYWYEGGPALSEIRIIESRQGARTALELEIEYQLNTAFALHERFSPFRFFVAPGQDYFWLGVVYFHAMADAESIVLLLRRVTEAYQGKISTEVSQPVEIYPRGHELMLSRPALLARKICALPSQAGNMRSSCRPPFRDPQDLNNGFVFFALEPRPLLVLGKAAKSAEVTLNDLFLALLMKSLSPLATRRALAPRRRRISVGCIVNLRKDLGLDRQQTFGLFLGSSVVTHEVPDEMSVIDLAKAIRRQTLALKQHKLYLATPLELGLARFLFSLYSTRGRQKFYQKNYPLWGGITNMNLNALWQTQDAAKPLDYFRAVSTGPATPLVLSVTTVNDFANIGLTFRSTVFSERDIERFKSEFFGAIEQVAARA
jgi:NRPS condensation-like uncharacterized protein